VVYPSSEWRAGVLRFTCRAHDGYDPGGLGAEPGAFFALQGVAPMFLCAPWPERFTGKRVRSCYPSDRRGRGGSATSQSPLAGLLPRVLRIPPLSGSSKKTPARAESASRRCRAPQRRARGKLGAGIGQERRELPPTGVYLPV